MSNVKAVKRTVTDVKLELGGKTRTVRFDLNAFAELENKYGSVDAAMQQLNEGKIGVVKMVLWAGLIHEEAVLDDVTGEPIRYNITPYQVGSWISPTDLPTIMQSINEAVTIGLPPAEAVVNNEEAKVDPLNAPAAVVPTEAEKAEEAKNE